MRWSRVDNELTLEKESYQDSDQDPIFPSPRQQKQQHTQSREEQPLESLERTLENPPAFGTFIGPKLLYFKEKELYDSFYPFLISRSSKISVFVLSGCLTTMFAIYLYRYLFSSAVSQGSMLMLSSRVMRSVSFSFSWCYLYFIWMNDRRAVISADLLLVLSSLASAMLLLARCMHGACEDGVPEDVCNPRSEENGVPTDTLVANLFMIVLLPIVFKAHTTNALVGSYLLTFIGLVASAIIANATSDVVMIFGCIFAFGIMMYDHKRNMLTMFLMLQDQQSYYDQLLAMERNRASAVIEKDELRNLIGNVAHDLKTPIQALMVEVDGLQVEIDSIVHLFPVDSPHYDSVSHFTNESQKYINSLRDIYQFAMMAINRAIEFRKTAAGLTLMPVDETFHLPHAIGWAVKRFADNPSGVKIRQENFINNLTEFCPYVTSDKHWMMENLLTLLSNACKFTSKGDIVVRTDIVTSKDVATSVLRNHSFLSNNGESQLPRSTVHFGDMNLLYERIGFEDETRNPDGEYFVRIVVEDTGIGVSEDAVGGLFQPHSNSKRLTGGTGLGLFSLAKHSEVLKGACGMYTRSDGLSGCGFWFTFPYRPDIGAWSNCDGSLLWKSSTRRAANSSMRVPRHSDNSTNDLSMSHCSIINELSSANSVEEKKKIVLVVDDSSMVLKTTSRMLRKEGYIVETAQNGEEALDLMKKNAYYFVLSDIQMPVMDGLDMTLNIREIERRNSLDRVPHYIIGMSANSDAETRKHALTSGMDVFIPKPVRMLELVKWLPSTESV